MIPKEDSAECSERSSRYYETALNAQKSAEVIAAEIFFSCKGCWSNAGNKVVNWALHKERLINWGFYDLAKAYQHVNY